jgi:hypothetical protein
MSPVTTSLMLIDHTDKLFFMTEQPKHFEGENLSGASLDRQWKLPVDLPNSLKIRQESDLLTSPTKRIEYIPVVSRPHYVDENYRIIK